jgi:hypothetical protein
LRGSPVRISDEAVRHAESDMKKEVRVNAKEIERAIDVA